MMTLYVEKKSFVSKPALIYSATGNSFALVDGREEPRHDAVQLAKDYCVSHQVDGLLLIESSKKAPLFMRIFNPDGSEAEMCGNGSRCVGHWAHHKAGLPERFEMESVAGLLKVSVQGDRVRVRLTEPRNFKEKIKIMVDNKRVEGYFINTGVPHAVIEVQKLNDLDVQKNGGCIRNDAQFKPNGTNASFFKRLSDQEIQVRTYERGVERETKSCGTGSAACALIHAYVHGAVSPVKVKTASGETLSIYFKKTNRHFQEVDLEGDVRSLNHLTGGKTL